MSDISERLRAAGLNVKALEWWDADTRDMCADTEFGRYQCAPSASGWWADVARGNKGLHRGRGSRGRILCSSPAEAQSVCQHDYERRILSALEVQS
jgi:hypothetical protein